LATEELKKELDSERQQSDSFIQEIESLSTLFNEVEEQNRRFTKQLKEKEETLLKVMNERLKQRQQVITIKEENKSMALKIKLDEERTKAMQATLNATKKALVETQSINRKLMDEAHALESQIELQKKVTADVAEKLRESSAEKTEIRAARDVAEARLLEISDRIHTEGFKSKRMEEELQKNGPGDNAGKSFKNEGDASLTSQMMESMRKKLNCTIVTDEPKEVVIVRCGHMFSRQCINDLVTNRNRKCPACGERFGQDDCRPIYF